MDHQESLRPEKKDELLTILADHHHRIILSYFRKSSDDVVSIQQLTEEIIERDGGEEEEVALKLLHSTLPRLAKTGVVEYDQRSNTVRYQGHSELERILCSIADL